MATPQKVAGDNSAAAAVSANAGILHGTPTADDNKADDNDIEEVDMPQMSQQNLSMSMQVAMGNKIKKSRTRALLILCLKIKKMSLIQLLFQLSLLSTTAQLRITLMALLKCKMLKKMMMAMTPVIANMATIAPRE